mmetsp:Transcript_25648/g.59275  ORF Transcript_25648/g.59275 Transcript_25648/m.59275 type:complete len:445 (-) Transcript_25648:122-1456(-)
MAAEAASTRTLKVSKGDDTRRLTVSWPLEATDSEKLSAIQDTVRSGFSLSATAQLVLKYADDEGDMCTLTVVGVQDLLSLVPEGAIKLRLEESQDGGLPNMAAAAQAAAGAAKAEASSCTGPAKSEATGSASTSNMPNGPRPGACFAGLALPFLPMAAAAANKQEHRAAGNRAGVAKREALLPVAAKLLEQLDRVPETARFRPAMQQYVDGADCEHFGDLAADILQAWASSSSQDQVREVMEACIGDILPILPLLGQGENDEDEGTAGCFREMENFFKAFGGMAGGASPGCTGPSASSPSAGCGMPCGGDFPLAGLLQGLLAANAAGQSSCANGASPTPDFAQGLGNLFAGFGKGFGKGPYGKGKKGWGKGWGKCHASDAWGAQECQQEPPEANSCKEGDEAEGLQQKVKDLMDMGLVEDPQVAEDLLRTHDGDIAAVVTTLTS